MKIKDIPTKKCTKHNVLMCVLCEYHDGHTCNQCGDDITDGEFLSRGDWCRECLDNEMMGNEYGGV